MRIGPLCLPLCTSHINLGAVQIARVSEEGDGSSCGRTDTDVAEMVRQRDDEGHVLSRDEMEKAGDVAVKRVAVIFGNLCLEEGQFEVDWLFIPICAGAHWGLLVITWETGSVEGWLQLGAQWGDSVLLWPRKDILRMLCEMLIVAFSLDTLLPTSTGVNWFKWTYLHFYEQEK